MPVNGIKKRREANGTNRHSETQSNWLLFISLNAAFFCLGMCCAFIGPCLHNLQLQTNSTLTQVSRLFISHACGSLVGSVISIYVVAGTSVITISMVFLVASLSIVPWCSSLTLLLASFSVQGLSLAVIANNCQMLYHQTCNSNARMKVSSLYVSFSVGAVAVTALCVALSRQFDSVTVTDLHSQNNALSLRHRRDTGLVNVTALGQSLNRNGTALSSFSNTQFLNASRSNDTVLIDNSTVLNESASSNTSLNNVSVVTLNVTPMLTTTPPPRKPQYLDAKHLKQDSNVADGSKFRHEIRKNLGNLPSEPGPASTTLPVTLQSHLLSNTSNDTATGNTSLPDTNVTMFTTNTTMLYSVANTTTINGTLSQNNSDELLASNVSSLSTLPDIMNELEALMTSDNRLASEEMLTHYTTNVATTENGLMSTHATSVAQGSSVTPTLRPQILKTHPSNMQLSKTSTVPLEPNILATSQFKQSFRVTESSNIHNKSRHNFVNVHSEPPLIPAVSVTVPNIKPMSTSKHNFHKPQMMVSEHPKQDLGVTDSSEFPGKIEQNRGNVHDKTLPFDDSIPSASPTVTLSSSSVAVISSASVTGSADKSESSRLRFIPLAVAVITLTVSSLFLSISCRPSFSLSRNLHKAPRPSSHAGRRTLRPTSQSHWSLVVLLLTTALLHYFHSALEWTYSGLVVEFAGSVMDWRRTWSLALLLVYWIGFTAGRIVCHYIVSSVRPWPLMFSGLLLGSVTGLVMLVGSLQYSSSAEIAARNALMWFSSVVLGLSTSVVLPTSLKYIPSTTSLSLAVTVGTSLGQASFPCTSALLSDIYANNSVILAVFAAAVGSTAFSILLKYVMAHSVKSSGSALCSTHFHLLDSSSIEDLDGMIPTDTAADEDAELLSQATRVDMETSLIVNSPTSSSSSSSLQHLIRNMSTAAKND